MENSPSATRHESADESGQRSVAPEANQLHGKKLPPERIGQVLVSADINPEALQGGEQPKNAATMSRSELLDMSQEISIDNTTLRHIYDTHLIGENGLRRLVQEHIKGVDLHETLHQEILEHQTDFERDPRLRRQLSKRNLPKAESINLKDLLKKAGIVETEEHDSRTVSSKKPGYHEHLESQLQKQAQQRKLLDLAFVGIILILLILVILLAFKRG